MAYENLGRGIGSIRTVCHPEAKDDPYPDDAPAKCKKGTCEHDWQARWYENGRSPKKNFKDKIAAQKHLTNRFSNKNIIEGRISKAKGRAPLFKDYSLEWLNDDKVDGDEVRPTTVKNYLSLLRLAWKHIGSKPITKITHADIAALIKKMESKNPETGQPFYNALGVKNLINHILVPIFRKAIKDRWRDINPAEDQKINKVTVTKRYLPPPREVHLVADKIKRFWRLAVYLMAGCGLREGEVVGLTTDCIQGDKIVVYRQRVDGSAIYGPLKHCEEGDSRWVPIDPILAAAIQEHIERYGVVEGGPLFPSSRSEDKMTPFTTTMLERYLREAVLELGLADKKLTAHNFRHFFASMCISRGVELAEVARMMGHQNINTTFKIYYQMKEDIAPRIAYAINAFLSEEIPDNVILFGAHKMAKTDNADRINELISELQALSGMEVILRPVALAA